MKARDFPQDLKPWFKHFEDVCYRHQPSTVYADWLRMTFAAFTNGLMEDSYRETIKPYDANELAAFQGMTGEWTKLMAQRVISPDEWHDPLGVIYETILSNFKAQGMGQFFTPADVSSMTAIMTGSKPRGIVNDPACGSGRLLVAHHAAYRSDRCYYVAQDLDIMCAHMTALNMVIHGARGEVIHGDTLRLDYRGAWLINPHLEDLGIPGIVPVAVHQTYLGGGRPPFFYPYETRQTAPEPKPIMPERTFAPGQQLTLF